jgi:hypothetical protein
LDQTDCRRSYFTVVDEEGIAHPAMEYVAATLDEQPVFHVLPLKRFVKLIATGENLAALGDGRFIGARSGRVFKGGARRADPVLTPSPAAASGGPSVRSG